MLKDTMRVEEKVKEFRECPKERHTIYDEISSDMPVLMKHLNSFQKIYLPKIIASSKRMEARERAVEERERRARCDKKIGWTIRRNHRHRIQRDNGHHVVFYNLRHCLTGVMKKIAPFPLSHRSTLLCLHITQALKQLLVVATAISLIACGGGGSSGVSSPIVTTGEFYRSNALAQVNADRAYTFQATGSGIRVGVVDSGVDATHPDLMGNISTESISITSDGEEVAIRDSVGHGTFVSGVIAAEKNDIGIHGIAYDAELLVAGTTSGRENLAKGLNYVSEHGAKVVNISAAGDGGFEAELTQALEDAAASDVIVVLAAGNVFTEGTFVYGATEATFINSSVANSVILAVGAVDADDNIASFSYRCGEDNLQCMVAPGVDIESTYLGGGTTVASGTSFAAPLVTGAAAVLMQLFPNLTPQQVVQILFDSATDLGDEGFDAVYGQGLLNLANAINPLGNLGVPLNASASALAPLSSTRLQPGAAFGDAFSFQSSLQKAVFVDAFQRAYDFDLTAYIEPALVHEATKLTLATDSVLELPVLAGLSMRVGFSSQAPAAHQKIGVGQVSPVSERAITVSDSALAINLHLSANTALGFGANTPSRQLFGIQHWGVKRHMAASHHNQEMLEPMQRLISPSLSFAMQHHLNKAMTLSLGIMRGTGGKNILGKRGWLTEAMLEHQFKTDATFGSAIGVVTEQDAFLNSVTAGAYGVNTAITRYIKLFGSAPLTTTTQVFADTTWGITHIEPHAFALLNNWSSVYSSAFRMGIVSKQLFSADDQLGFTLGSPLRVYDANATLSIPSAQNTDGSIVFHTQRSDLSPSGRELDFQVSYSRRLDWNTRLSSGLLLQLQPVHNLSMQPNVGIRVRLMFNH